MEISAMVTELKNKAVNLANILQTKETEANSLRDRLHAIEEEIKPLADEFDAVKMAIDALSLVPSASVPVFVAEKQMLEAKIDVPFEECKNENVAARKNWSRQCKKIGKYNPKGKKIGEFPSINNAAKMFGWSNIAMKKYVEGTTHEKQIKLRGYYLDYISA